MLNPAWEGRYPPQLVELLNSLNEHQLAAASVGPGQASLIGVPGSGKTRTLIARIARLVADGLDPDYILAMTFTRAAATEMTERLHALGIAGARVGTIHSVSRQIVAAETDLFDTGELNEGWKLHYELKKLLVDMRKQRRLPSRGVDLDCVSRFIEACKSCGPCYVFNDPWGMNLRAEEFIMRQARGWSLATGLNPQRLSEIYVTMEQRRVACGLYDYNDMQLWSWMQLMADPVAREKWRGRWSVVIVDEAQDSNSVQWDLARFLTGMESCIEKVSELPGAPTRDDGSHNLMVGGDPSQSIFGWRYAAPEEFVKYTNAADVEMLVLPINYRSNKTICGVGTALVQDKKWHLAGKITSHSDAPAPDAVLVERYDNPEVEAGAVMDSCLSIAQTQGLRSCAVLARLRIGLDMAEIECIRRRVKYIKRASGSFLESKEVNSVLAYMRVASGHDPDGKWVKYLINRPFRYIGKVFITRCEDQAMLNNVSLLDAIVGMKGSLSYKQRLAIDNLVKLLKDMNKIVLLCEEREAHEEKKARGNEMVIDGKLSMEVIDRLAELEVARGAAGEAGEGLPEDKGDGAKPDKEETYTAPPAESDEPIRGPADLITMMLDRTGYIEAIRREEGLAGMDESKLAVFGELHRMACMFRTVAQFLAYIDGLKVAVRRAQKSGLRVREAGAEDALVLSTIHSAKGLEWDHVFLVDVVPGRFPCARSEDYEEELRLLYVAVTRAAESCTVTYSGPAPSHSDRLDQAQSRVSPFITLVKQGIDRLKKSVTST